MDVQYLNSLTSPESIRSRSQAPIFFLDEGIKGYIHLQQPLSDGLSAQIRLTGTICLDTTHTLSHYGALEMQHRPIDSRMILDISQDFSITEDGTPFYIEIPNSSLEGLQFPASVDIASSNISTDFNLGPGSFQFLIASVGYEIEISIRKCGVDAHKTVQEVRFLTSSSGSFDILTSKQKLAKEVSWKPKLPSLKQIASQRSAITNNLTIEVTPLDSLNFGSQSDAAATRATIRLRLEGDLGSDMMPPPIKIATSWNLESITDLRLTDSQSEPRESSLELRKELSGRTQQVTLSNWSKDPVSSGNAALWHCEHDFWITEPLGSWLPPTFRTSYLSQKYSLNLRIKVEEKGRFNGRRASLDFDLPVIVAYEQGCVPSYTHGTSPPQYVCETA